ncbi:hypothetical protein [Lysinibacillus sphaericus]|uniref:hypothetical protein n=1 Tax=Lysinibacillus sphaericus TaxID=1421 RepID=UPI000C19C476|nr:hypothetical protein [Lysinibacillus sphaericus]PIJ98004.1 hypothetical protein CTN02_09680 [Lysinibacillus sphaericus]
MSQELTLFDLGVEDTTQSEEQKKKESSKKSSVVKSTPAPKKKEEPLLVNADWTIHFATDHFFVSDFVDEMHEEGITLEVLREGIERHFPQFSAARTKWDYDKDKKQLFPDAFAGSKGADSKEGRFTPSFFISAEDAFEANNFYRYILSGDNKVLSVHQSICGTMITPTKGVSEATKAKALKDLGLNEITEWPITPATFEWSLPKIENKILRQIIGFFRSFIHEEAEYEVALKIYWDLKKEKYVVDCPKQVVTAINIELQHSEDFTGKNAARYIPVMEVHSHNVMRAFFSEIDDSDEQAFNTTFGVFGVFGRLNRKQYEMVFRAKMRDDVIDIHPEQLFDLEEDRRDYSYPKHWKSNVTTMGGFYL